MHKYASKICSKVCKIFGSPYFAYICTPNFADAWRPSAAAYQPLLCWTRTDTAQVRTLLSERLARSRRRARRVRLSHWRSSLTGPGMQCRWPGRALNIIYHCHCGRLGRWPAQGRSRRAFPPGPVVQAEPGSVPVTRSPPCRLGRAAGVAAHPLYETSTGGSNWATYVGIRSPLAAADRRNRSLKLP